MYVLKKTNGYDRIKDFSRLAECYWQEAAARMNYYVQFYTSIKKDVHLYVWRKRVSQVSVVFVGGTLLYT